MIDDALVASGLKKKLEPTVEQQVADKLKRMDQEVAMYLKPAVRERGFVSPEIRQTVIKMYQERVHRLTSDERDAVLALFLSVPIIERYR